MPSHRVLLHFRAKLKEPRLSCSREIDISRRGLLRKRAWWPCGVALDTFDEKIVPEIKALRQSLDCGEADPYIRLYMIGRRPENARPIIMVCCTDRDIRTQLEKAIKKSKIPKSFPEFKVGPTALPQEQPSIIRPLADTDSEMPDSGTEFDLVMADLGEEESLLFPAPRSLGEVSMEPSPDAGVPANQDLFASVVGRRVRIQLDTDASENVRLATGGVLFCIGTKLYQLTASHALEELSAPEIDTPDLDELDLDWLSDDSDDEDDNPQESTDEQSIRDLDVRLTSRESASPAPGIDPWDTDMDDNKSWLSDEPSVASPGSEQSMDPLPWQTSSSPTSDTRPAELTIHRSALVHSSHDSPNPTLDYALIPIPNDCNAKEAKTYNNAVAVWQGGKKRDMPVLGIAPIEGAEKEIIAVTASSGPTYGRLMPSAIYLIASPSKFQKLYAITLCGTVQVGDSGSAVIDADTGKLYGHIVRGVPGTPTAYIVAASEVLDDIQQRVSDPVRLATTCSYPSMPLGKKKTPASPAGERATDSPQVAPETPATTATTTPTSAPSPSPATAATATAQPPPPLRRSRRIAAKSARARDEPKSTPQNKSGPRIDIDMDIDKDSDKDIDKDSDMDMDTDMKTPAPDAALNPPPKAGGKSLTPHLPLKRGASMLSESGSGGRSWRSLSPELLDIAAHRPRAGRDYGTRSRRRRAQTPDLLQARVLRPRLGVCASASAAASC